MCARGYRSGEIGLTASGAGGDAGRSGLFCPDLSGNPRGGGQASGISPQQLLGSFDPAPAPPRPGLGPSFCKRLCNHDERLLLPGSSKETNCIAHKDQLELFVRQQTLKNRMSHTACATKPAQ